MLGADMGKKLRNRSISMDDTDFNRISRFAKKKGLSFSLVMRLFAKYGMDCTKCSKRLEQI